MINRKKPAFNGQHIGSKVPISTYLNLIKLKKIHKRQKITFNDNNKEKTINSEKFMETIWCLIRWK